MSRPPEPLFLARQSYRRRRLGDAARVLPILGLVLMLMPVLWADGATTRGGLIYIFVTWAILILVVAVISTRLADDRRSPEDPENGENGEV